LKLYGGGSADGRLSRQRGGDGGEDVCDLRLHGALVAVVAFAVEWSPAVAPAVASVVAATGRLPMVVPLAAVGPVAGEVA